jgi:hypothetical protein
MGRKKLEPLVNPLEQSKKKPTFEERYEESLKRKLFEDMELQNNDDEDESDYYEETRNIKHQKRDGE